MDSFGHTDLALEAEESRRAKENSTLPGVSIRSDRPGGCLREWVDITDRESAAALGKAPGRYVTLEPRPMLRRLPSALGESAGVLAESLRALLPPLAPEDAVLVVGLGNEVITPDALGPLTIRSIFVTRHLRRHLPKEFGRFRPVAALETGVLSTTGMETAETISAVCEKLRPGLVIAVDALACSQVSRLCRTVQLTDTGISPGAGVGNRRVILDQASLHIPVLAVGVPTVIAAGSLAGGAAGAELKDLVVTPRDIDSQVRTFAKLLGYGICLALQPDMTIEDLEMLMA